MAASDITAAVLYHQQNLASNLGKHFTILKLPTK